MTLLSIITVNRNNSQGLACTLCSFEPIRNHPLIEFVFVDGHSCDDSLIIAESFYDPSLIICELDTGPFDAMNKGAILAGGDFLMWINSGDTLNSYLLDDRFFDIVQSNRQCDMIALSCNTISGPTLLSTDNPQFHLKRLPYGSFSHPSLLVRRDHFFDMGGFNLDYKIGADRDLVVRSFLSDSRIAVFNIPTSNFYLGGISTTRSTYMEHINIDVVNQLYGRTRYNIYRLAYVLGFTRLANLVIALLILLRRLSYSATRKLTGLSAVIF